MRKYEDKYGLRSSDFYAAMESGQLAAFDDAEHPAFQEFIEWHGLYKVWLKREQRYSLSLRSYPLFAPVFCESVAGCQRILRDSLYW
ncbi:MAG: hypothetical protein R3E79_25355 [Caldilineaceae bacterium]